MTARQWTADEIPARGPLTIKEKPEQRLVERQAYLLPDALNSLDHLAHFRDCAEWLKGHGIRVPFINVDGMLVITFPFDGEDSGPYYEWISDATLFVLQPTTPPSVEAYGPSMLKLYGVEVPGEDRVFTYVEGDAADSGPTPPPAENPNGLPLSRCGFANDPEHAPHEMTVSGEWPHDQPNRWCEGGRP